MGTTPAGLVNAAPDAILNRFFHPKPAGLHPAAAPSQACAAAVKGDATGAVEPNQQQAVEDAFNATVYRSRSASAELNAVGALAVGIPGSAPTIYALVDDFEVARNTEAWLSEHYKKNETGFVHICRADQGGARVID